MTRLKEIIVAIVVIGGIAGFFYVAGINPLVWIGLVEPDRRLVHVSSRPGGPAPPPLAAPNGGTVVASVYDFFVAAVPATRPIGLRS
jgi:hypothetical protein